MLKTAAALLLCLAATYAQPAPSFEVADVKANTSGETKLAVDFQPGGKFSAHNVPLKVLIQMAYGVRPDALIGAPAWTSAARYDIVAKAAQTTTPADVRLMVQSLLRERFQLAIHTESRDVPAYALLIGKTGSKLQPTDAALLTDQRCTAAAGDIGVKHVECRHMTAAMLAGQLQELSPREIDAVVVDKTGLTGAYDFRLDWTPAVPAGPDPPDGPSIFQAVESQLGLKLERRKLPLPVIVVDRVERPSEN